MADVCFIHLKVNLVKVDKVKVDKVKLVGGDGRHVIFFFILFALEIIFFPNLEAIILFFFRGQSIIIRKFSFAPSNLLAIFTRSISHSTIRGCP